MDLQPNKTDSIVKPITNTRISASEWNQLAASCMAFITRAGLTPDAADNQQFLNAFIQIAQNIGAIGANVDLSNLSVQGKSLGAGLALPSSKYIDLTLGASGSTYTAPANGYAFLGKISGTNTAYVLLFNATTKMGAECRSNETSNNLRVYLPVKKGDVFGANYSATGNTTFFRFIYANGSDN